MFEYFVADQTSINSLFFQDGSILSMVMIVGTFIFVLWHLYIISNKAHWRMPVRIGVNAVPFWSFWLVPIYFAPHKAIGGRFQMGCMPSVTSCNLLKKYSGLSESFI